jgi:23S rRNA pseudouridine2605 synthase
MKNQHSRHNSKTSDRYNKNGGSSHKFKRNNEFKERSGSREEENKRWSSKPIKESNPNKNKFSSFKPAGNLKFKTAEERFIAHAGICSRREADKLISDGLITINGKVVTELGTKVKSNDEVRYGGELLRSEKKVYVLLNKPKGFITTVDDDRARKTVMDLVSNACPERIYPVGRLDRATTGVLLLTNDGSLAKKLTHPSDGAKKVYMVTLDKPFHNSDLMKLRKGIELEDGMAKVDYIEFVKENDKYTLGVEIHIGKNRIVRRMFSALGYEVSKLDRSSFAGLTKKGLNRGQYRMLNSKDLSFLKML